MTIVNDFRSLNGSTVSQMICPSFGHRIQKKMSSALFTSCDSQVVNLKFETLKLEHRRF